MLSWDKDNGRVPEWLQKWAALALEFVELEQKLLPEQLVAQAPVPGLEPFTPENAASQAKGQINSHTLNSDQSLSHLKMLLIPSVITSKNSLCLPSLSVFSTLIIIIPTIFSTKILILETTRYCNTTLCTNSTR